jgi:hypothetical protein
MGDVYKLGLLVGLDRQNHVGRFLVFPSRAVGFSPNNPTFIPTYLMAFLIGKFCHFLYEIAPMLAGPHG